MKIFDIGISYNRNKNKSIQNNKKENNLPSKDITFKANGMESLANTNKAMINFNKNIAFKGLKTEKHVELKNKLVKGSLSVASAKLIESGANALYATGDVKLRSKSIVPTIKAKNVELDGEGTLADNIYAEELVKLSNKATVSEKVQAKNVELDGEGTAAQGIIASESVNMHNHSWANNVAGKNIKLERQSAAVKIHGAESVELFSESGADEIFKSKNVKLDGKNTFAQEVSGAEEVKLTNGAIVAVVQNQEKGRGLISAKKVELDGEGTYATKINAKESVSLENRATADAIDAKNVKLIGEKTFADVIKGKESASLENGATASTINAKSVKLIGEKTFANAIKGEESASLDNGASAGTINAKNVKLIGEKTFAGVIMGEEFVSLENGATADTIKSGDCIYLYDQTSVKNDIIMNNDNAKVYLIDDARVDGNITFEHPGGEIFILRGLKGKSPFRKISDDQVVNGKIIDLVDAEPQFFTSLISDPTELN